MCLIGPRALMSVRRGSGVRVRVRACLRVHVCARMCVMCVSVCGVSVCMHVCACMWGCVCPGGGCVMCQWKWGDGRRSVPWHERGCAPVSPLAVEELLSDGKAGLGRGHVYVGCS